MHFIWYNCTTLMAQRAQFPRCPARLWVPSRTFSSFLPGYGSVCFPVRVAAHVWRSVGEPKTQHGARHAPQPSILAVKVDLSCLMMSPLSWPRRTVPRPSPLPFSAIYQAISRATPPPSLLFVRPPHLSSLICPCLLRASLRPCACRRNLSELNWRAPPTRWTKLKRHRLQAPEHMTAP